jgi:hypothetical protein
MSSKLDELLREFGFKLEDFPESLRTNSVLLRYAESFPRVLRAEYLGALCEFFRVYQRLNDVQRAEMLEKFQLQLEEELARKRWDH